MIKLCSLFGTSLLIVVVIFGPSDAFSFSPKDKNSSFMSRRHFTLPKRG